MKFTRRPNLSVDIAGQVVEFEVWACEQRDHSYVITRRGDWYKATTKRFGGEIGDGTTIPLGDFQRFSDAQAACEAFSKQQVH